MSEVLKRWKEMEKHRLGRNTCTHNVTHTYTFIFLMTIQALLCTFMLNIKINKQCLTCADCGLEYALKSQAREHCR